MVTPSGPGDHYRHSGSRETEPAAGPHHTARAPVVCPGTALFCCSIVVFLVVTVLMFFFFWIMLPFLSVLFVFLCVFYFWLVSVCVHVRLSRKLWLLSLSWGKLKEKDWGERGAESGVIDSMCGTSWHRGHLHTHTCPSLKMSGSLIGQIVVMRPVGMEIRADTLDIWGKSLIRFLSESWMRRWIPLSCLYAKCKSVAMRQLA